MALTASHRMNVQQKWPANSASPLTVAASLVLDNRHAPPPADGRYAEGSGKYGDRDSEDRRNFRDGLQTHIVKKDVTAKFRMRAKASAARPAIRDTAAGLVIIQGDDDRSGRAPTAQDHN